MPQPLPPASTPRASGEHEHEHESVVDRASFIRLFLAVMLPIFLAAIDQTLLATATPAIARELGDLRDSSWIAIAYLLASTIMAPLYGRLGDRYGRRDALLAALALFAFGSGVCAAAFGMWGLIGARLLQGLGGGGLMVMSQALIGEVVPPRQRAHFQAWFGVVFMLASVSGPLLGGLLVGHASWRWLFLINLPLAALAAWRVLKLPESPKHAEPGQSHDAAGVLLFALTAAGALLWTTLGGHQFPWASPTSLALLAATLGCGWQLLRHERRQLHPFLPLELLRQPAIAHTAVTAMLFACCMFALVFFLPVYLQLVHGGSAASSGLLLLPLTFGLVFGSNLTGRLVARTRRPDLPPRFGLLLAAAAQLGLATLSLGSSGIATFGLVAGLGYGTVMPTSQLLIQTVAGRSRLGAAAATVSLARSLGASLGTALFGALVFGLVPAATLQAALQGGAPQLLEPVRQAFHMGFGAAAAITLFAAAWSARVPEVHI